MADNFESTVRPGTNSTDRRSFNAPVLVGALVGTSAGGSSDILNNYDIGNPALVAGTTIPAGDLSAILGYRTLGFVAIGLGAGDKLQVEVSGLSQFNKQVGDKFVLDPTNDTCVTLNAYIGKPTIILTALNPVTSAADLDICSVGFGSPIPFETTPVQVLFNDVSAGTGGTYAAATVTYDETYHTFTASVAPAIGDRYYVCGCSDCTREPQDGLSEPTPAASF